MTIAPSLWDLVIAAALLSINAIISIAFTLGIARSIFIAALRMVVQMALIGVVLKVLLTTENPWLTLAMATVMISAAGYEIMRRQDHRLTGLWGYGLGALSVLTASGIVTLIALAALLQPDPWYTPRYAIPLFGMIIGNTMTGISLGLSHLFSVTLRERPEIEAQLLLGASRWQAMRPAMRGALKAGFMPIINSMSAVGLVSLPGMMTGQILAGAEPEIAVSYQLLIMFLIAAATGGGVLIAVFSGTALVTDARHRVRPDRLHP